MSRLAFVLASLLAALVATAPASAAPETVVGAGSYNQAPAIEPGKYSDTIRGSETNVYAVDIEAGQSVSASVTLDKRQFSGNSGIVALSAIVDSPGRTPAAESDPVLFAASGDKAPAVAEADGPPAVDSETALPEDAFPAPGRWYIRVSVDDPNGEVGPLEFPVKLDVQVDGTPVETDETEEPPIEEEEPEEAPAETDDEDSGSGTGTLVAFGAGGVLLGAIAGISLVSSRRRKSA